MKKKLIKFIKLVVFIPVLFALIFYVIVAIVYNEGFSYGTYINGVYSTAKSKNEVNEILKKNFNNDRITINSSRFNTEYIYFNDFDMEIDYMDALNTIFDNQNPWTWPRNLFKSFEYNISPTFYYSNELLKANINNLQFVNVYSESNENTVKIIYDKDNGYSLTEDLAEYVDCDEIFDDLKECINGDLSLDVDTSYFHKKDLSLEDIEVKKTWDELSAYLSKTVSLNMGSEIIELDSKFLSSVITYNAEYNTIKRDDYGKVFYNEEKIYAFVDSICDEYDTYKKARDYVTYNGEVKHIELSIYGTLINREKLKKDVLFAIKNMEVKTITPDYVHEGFVRGKNDIGSTFIEVDLTSQLMYYIKNGDLVYTFDIVSGKPNAANETPEVVCFVQNKLRNRYLRGADYVSFVKYWIPFYKADGFHDASWQREFGGDRYIRHGSHGCINMRLDDVKNFYEAVEIGTPVIVYK